MDASLVPVVSGVALALLGLTAQFYFRLVPEPQAIKRHLSIGLIVVSIGFSVLSVIAFTVLPIASVLLTLRIHGPVTHAEIVAAVGSGTVFAFGNSMLVIKHMVMGEIWGVKQSRRVGISGLIPILQNLNDSVLEQAKDTRRLYQAM